MTDPAHILVIRGGAIGDFVLTLPAFAALRRLQSHSANPRLEILGYPCIASLAVAAGLADATRSIESPALAPFFTRDCPVPPEQARYFAQFDLVVSYIYDPEHVFAQRVASVTKARFVQGPHRPDEQAGIHATKVLLGPLEALGVHDSPPEPRLTLPSPSPFAHQFGDNTWLAIHPGSGSPHKNWPEESWAILLEQLLATTPWNVLLIGGEAEGDRPARLASRLPSTRVTLAQNLPLVELAQHLRCCAQFLGHDSGITHLAAALGLPVIVLWGETNPNIWRPLSSKATLIRHPAGLQSLPVSTVLHSLRHPNVNCIKK